ncbi:MAG TPA: hypothetical protein ENK96_03180 [Desulfobulbaceae bacterium]|nr:hypothetical protein [Desulfobulbaceae bacterium]
MRILFFLEALGGGGIERVTITLSKEYLLMGHQVGIVLVEKKGDLLDEIPEECGVYELGNARMPHLIFCLSKILKNYSPDLLIACSWPYTAVAIIAKKLSNVSLKLLVTEHTDFRLARRFTKKDHFILKNFGRYIYSYADMVAGVSKGVVESVSEVTGYSVDDMRVLYNPVRVMNPMIRDNKYDSLLQWWKEKKSESYRLAL